MSLIWRRREIVFANKDPFTQLMGTIFRLNIIKDSLTINVMHLNNFTQKYAEVWYNENMIPREGVETQE